MLKPTPVDELRRKHHRRLQHDPAKAPACLHHRRQVRQQGRAFDLPIELGAPLQFVVEQRMILAEYQAIVGRQGGAVRRQVLQPLHVRCAPVGALAIHKPAQREARQDVLARLEDLATARRTDRNGGAAHSSAQGPRWVHQDRTSKRISLTGTLRLI